MKRSNILRIGVVSFGIGTILTLLTGCGSHQASTPPAKPPPTMTVAAVEPREVIEWEEFTGRTEAVDTVEVQPRVSGYIQEVRFRSGQMVQKDDELFVIDPRWHQAEYDRRRAEADRARVQLENTEREADRSSQLLKVKAISAEEAEARISRFHEAKAALLAAEAARDSAKLDLDYTRVRAPISGRVSRALLTEGNYVSGQAGSATRLTTIVSVNPVYVYADMDEDSLLKFNRLSSQGKLEMDDEGRVPVELQLGDESTFSHRGHVESLDNQLNPSTGSILVRAVFPNEDGRIVPGLFARIRIPMSARGSALLITDRAIGTDQALKFVLRLTPTNTVAYQPVELGPLVDGLRLVRNGLKPGDEIVVNGIQTVRPGAAVQAQRVKESDSEPRVATTR